MKEVGKEGNRKREGRRMGEDMKEGKSEDVGAGLLPQGARQKRT